MEKPEARYFTAADPDPGKRIWTVFTYQVNQMTRTARVISNGETGDHIAPDLHLVPVDVNQVQR